MMYAITGSAVMGAFQQNETQLDRWARLIRSGARKFIDFLTQPGTP